MLKRVPCRPSRAENRSKTREQLLLSARQVFARNGYAGSSVDLIAESVGYSKGAFYSNFESKDAIFLKLLEQQKTEEIAALAFLLESSENIDVLFEQICNYYKGLESDADWGLLAAEFQIQAGRDPELAKQVVKLYRAQRASLAMLIQKLFTKTGRTLPASSEELAVTFCALTVGLSLQCNADRSGIRKGLVGDAILLVLKSLLAASPGLA